MSRADGALQRGATVYLRRPRPADRAAFLAGARRSRALHAGWVRAPRTAAEFARFLARAGRGDELHVVCRRRDDEVIGVINLSNLARGIQQTATVGFYAFVPHAGRGHLTEGLALVLVQAFRRYKLHRLEANVQPGNRASHALVRRVGFRREGYSPRLIKLGGRWRDHVRYAILADEWAPGRRRAAQRGS